MKKQTPSFPPLRIPGELQSIESQIGKTLHRNISAEQRRNRGANPLHDITVRSGNRVEFRSAGDRQDEGVIQTSWALQNRSSAGATPQNGNVQFSAVILKYFLREVLSVPKDGKVSSCLPKYKKPIRMAALAMFQERFVQRQEFCGKIRGDAVGRKKEHEKSIDLYCVAVIIQRIKCNCIFISIRIPACRFTGR